MHQFVIVWIGIKVKANNYWGGNANMVRLKRETWDRLLRKRDEDQIVGLVKRELNEFGPLQAQILIYTLICWIGVMTHGGLQ